MVGERMFITQKRNLLVLFLLIFAIHINAQDKHRTYLRLDYLKNTQNKRILTAGLKAKVDGQFLLLSNHTINFSIGGDSIVTIGQIKTNEQGKAIVELKNDIGEGAVVYIAEFEGNDTLRARESEVEVTDVKMKMELALVDSIKTITISTSSAINPETEKDISEEVDVEVFVQRMFSLLPIEKGTIEDGECSIEFPDDLPGDSAGNVVVIAKIVDHELFANVEQRQVIKWGVPVELVQKDYNPFVAGEYIKFMLLAILLVVIVVFIIYKIVNNRAKKTV